MTLKEDGYAVVENVLSLADCDKLVALVRTHGSQSAGSRCLLEHEWAKEIATILRSQLALKLNEVQNKVVVQCTYFHKSGDKNWLVPWHQDRSIPVKNKVPSQELTGWSRKEGVHFLHAPEAVLSEMLAVRLHIDDSNTHNGPLCVLPGTHLAGTLSSEQIEQSRNTIPERKCTVRKGGVVLMRPLLLHASAKSTTTEPRRVLHFLFAPANLPHALTWRWAI